jgi:hypothetical protein
MSKEIFEKEDINLALDIPKEKRNLLTASYDYSVQFLYGLMSGSDPKIVLSVPFQRHFIWKNERASQLIESIIMNVPIPPLYFAEEGNGKWLVIDGLQRLNSILTYFQNEYGLKNLEIIKELEGLKYKDLPPKAQSLLDDGMLRVNVIKKDSHPDIKYDIFMRLNTGAVTLNYQELRNCLFRGALNDTAKELVENNKEFLSILKLKKPHERFLDVEFVIRYFSFSKNLKQDDKGKYYVDNYGGSLVSYINDFMKDNQHISVEDQLHFKSNFNSVIAKVVQVFGVKDAFRDLSTTSTKVNKAISDCIMLSFERVKEEDLISKKDEIRNLLIRMLNEDVKFKRSISVRTSDTDALNYRLDSWFREMKNVVNF